MAHLTPLKYIYELLRTAGVHLNQSGTIKYTNRIICSNSALCSDTCSPSTGGTDKKRDRIHETIMNLIKRKVPRMMGRKNFGEIKLKFQLRGKSTGVEGVTELLRSLS